MNKTVQSKISPLAEQSMSSMYTFVRIHLQPMVKISYRPQFHRKTTNRSIWYRRRKALPRLMDCRAFGIDNCRWGTNRLTIHTWHSADLLWNWKQEKKMIFRFIKSMIVWIRNYWQVFFCFSPKIVLSVCSRMWCPRGNIVALISLQIWLAILLIHKSVSMR